MQSRQKCFPTVPKLVADKPFVHKDLEEIQPCLVQDLRLVRYQLFCPSHFTCLRELTRTTLAGIHPEMRVVCPMSRKIGHHAAAEQNGRRRYTSVYKQSPWKNQREAAKDTVAAVQEKTGFPHRAIHQGGIVACPKPRFTFIITLRYLHAGIHLLSESWQSSFLELELDWSGV